MAIKKDSKMMLKFARLASQKIACHVNVFPQEEEMSG